MFDGSLVFMCIQSVRMSINELVPEQQIMLCPTGEYSLEKCNSWELDYVELKEKPGHHRICSMEIHNNKVEFRAISTNSKWYYNECHG